MIQNILKSVTQMPNSVYNVVGDHFSVVFFDCASRFLYRIKQEYDGYNDTYEKLYTDDQKLITLDQYSDTIVRSEEYLQKLSTKLAPSIPILEFDTDAAVFKIERLQASDVQGSTYTINNSKNYTVTFPADFFTGSTITDPTTVIKVLSISWKIPPKTFYKTLNHTSVSPMVTLSLLDDYLTPINSITKPFTLKIPAESSSNTTASSLTANNCSLQMSALAQPQLPDCSKCSQVQLAELTCDRLATLYVGKELGEETCAGEGCYRGRQVLKGVGRDLLNKSKISFNVGCYFTICLGLVHLIGYYLIHKCDK